MNLPTQIALDVLTRLEKDGQIKKDAHHKDAELLPTVAAIVDANLKDMREEFANFCIWWAEIGHDTHKIQGAPPFAHTDFWHCQNPMCLSLVGTIADLARELRTQPAQLAENAGYAPPSVP